MATPHARVPRAAVPAARGASDTESAAGAVGPALARAAAIVDVRSPGEFGKGAVPGAVNIPLFADGERAEIGTLYKHVGRQQAIDAGMSFVGGRLAEFVRAFEPYRRAPLLVYCARGGMRSGAVVSLLSSLGFPVTQLEGGYKAYRRYVLDALPSAVPPRLIVIHGATGVGKTLLLRELPNALDLEGLAQHRSSLFGAVNLRPRTQQQFEAGLLHALQGLDHGRPVWVEGESRKVGDAILPDSLRAAMQAATCVLVTASIPTRVRRIVAEYGGGDTSRGPDASTLAQLEQALRALTAHFGHARTDAMAAQVQAGELAPVVETLLEEYYDPRYAHAMRNYRYALELSSEDLGHAVGKLKAFAEKLDMDRPATSEPCRALGG